MVRQEVTHPFGRRPSLGSGERHAGHTFHPSDVPQEGFRPPEGTVLSSEGEGCHWGTWRASYQRLLELPQVYPSEALSQPCGC